MKPRRKRSSTASARPDLLARTLKERRKRTLIVVADGERARFFSPTPDARSLVPAPQSESISPQTRHRAHYLTTDSKRGSRASRRIVREVLDSPRDDEGENHRFALEVGRLIEDAYDHNEFDQLVLVAPPRNLGELRQALPKRLRDKVGKEVPKDLTDDTVPALWRRISPLIRSIL